MISSLNDRQKKLLEVLAEDPARSVPDLARHFAVSEVTIRNDLNALAETGLLVRVRGGGFPAFHPGIFERQRQHAEAKIRIARAAAGLIRNGDEVMIVAGTTTSLIPRFLLGKQNIKIVTNSTLMLPYIRINPGVQVTLTGGEFRPSAEALVGPDTLRGIERFHVPMAFIGTDGFSLDRGITADTVEIADVVVAMARRAERIILVADSSKVGRTGFAHIMGADRIHTIITDDGVAPAVVEEFKGLGIDVRVV